jgi:hypothetical protein
VSSRANIGFELGDADLFAGAFALAWFSTHRTRTE